MSTFLLIDAGNTRVKWATATTHGAIKLRGELSTNLVTQARLKALAKKYPAERVVLACVVPKLLPIFRRAFGKGLFEVSGDASELGLKFDYPKPGEIGADRLAAAVAAYALGKWPAIVVNCGTATAYTVLNAKGELCGGAIAPGPEVQLMSLASSTAQLPKATLRGVHPIHLARNTQNALRSGVLLSFQGGVRETIARLGKDISPAKRPTVILTGGYMNYLPGDIAGRREPLLVFKGLRIIGARAKP